MRVEHIGIAVRSLDESRKIYESMFPEAAISEWKLPAQGIDVLIIRAENTKVELIEAIDEDSPIGRFIAKRGEGMHHIAYITEDIESAIGDMREKGLHFLTDSWYTGAEDYRVIFIDPRDTGGVLTEICQDPNAPGEDISR